MITKKRETSDTNASSGESENIAPALLPSIQSAIP